MQKEISGYFTVEAAMVMPIVLGAVFLVMYLLIFQYNRCLMEQDVGVLALRGSRIQVETQEDRIAELREGADALYEEKYIAWNLDEVKLKVEKGVLSVERSAKLKIPFEGIGKGSNAVWTVNANYKNQVLSPVSFIRYYRKLKGGKDDTDRVY